VDYTEIDYGTVYDGASGYCSLPFEMAVFQWLNRLNPDWKQVLNPTPITVTGLTGEGVIAVPNLASADLTIDPGNTPPDFWWGSNTIAKYGVLSAMSGEFISMPLQFINALKTNFNFDYALYDGLYYNLAPGCTLSGLISQYGNPPGNISIVPQVNWYDAYGGTDNPNGPLAPGATPYGTYQELP
jgi:hypothetical protein